MLCLERISVCFRGLAVFGVESAGREEDDDQCPVLLGNGQDAVWNSSVTWSWM